MTPTTPAKEWYLLVKSARGGVYPMLCAEDAKDATIEALPEGHEVRTATLRTARSERSKGR